MLASIVMIAVLHGTTTNPQIEELYNFGGETKSQTYDQAWKRCKKVERMLKPCMMKEDLNSNTYVYTNLDTYFKLKVKHK